MPFRSEKQRRYLWKFEPQIAKRWAHGQHSSSGNHRMPSRSGPDVASKRRAGRRASRKSRKTSRG